MVRNLKLAMGVVELFRHQTHLKMLILLYKEPSERFVLLLFVFPSLLKHSTALRQAKKLLFEKNWGHAAAQSSEIKVYYHKATSVRNQ